MYMSRCVCRYCSLVYTLYGGWLAAYVCGLGVPADSIYGVAHRVRTFGRVFSLLAYPIPSHPIPFHHPPHLPFSHISRPLMVSFLSLEHPHLSCITTRFPLLILMAAFTTPAS